MELPSNELVRSDCVYSSRLYRNGSSLAIARVEVGPALAVYVAGAAWAYQSSATPLATGLIAGGIVLLHAVVVLVQLWSLTARCALRHVRLDSTTDISSASFLLVSPSATAPWEQCPIQSISGIPGFTFQRRRFVWAYDVAAFVELDFPTRHVKSTYVRTQGLSGHDDDMVFIERSRFGLNLFDVPLPTFGELMKEHATAPFFIFQMFCVGLWLLDEYWYYSLMTLGMLILFEMSVVKRRIMSLEQVRGMRAPAYEVSVHRAGRWRNVSTSELLPGDVMSLTRALSAQHSVPCDVLLLRGHAVIDESLLTGESVPQLKEPLISSADLHHPLEMEGPDKCHVIWGGTQVIIHSGANSDDSSDFGVSQIKRPSDNGALVYVLRTGFHTAQGRLLSTILCSTERVTVNNLDAFLFILVLLVFALAASGYVLYNAWGDPDRSHSKLILNCIMIITSVVPPELPMELSLAVNTSLVALIQKRIFCTEPFRIPFAGAVDTVCFDKTGTLTEDTFEFMGVAGNEDKKSTVKVDGQFALIPGPSCSIETQRVIATCHSLVYLEGGLVGDPLEKAALSALKWQAQGGATGINVVRGSGDVCRIVRRLAFDSSVARMSCIVNVNDKQNIVVCKGAPEVIHRLCISVPLNYTSTHRHYSRAGCRVLAMAYKELQGSITERQAAVMQRTDIESQLIFAGFLVLHSPMKKSSLETVSQFRASSHFVVMITGDHALTACDVARRLNIIAPNDPTFVLSWDRETNVVSWQSTDDDEEVLPFDASCLPSDVNLCVTGPAFERANMTEEQKTQLMLTAKVFARVSPVQKQTIVMIMKSSGRVTLMCGDGTNDVGALKAAHVGVALLQTAISSPNQVLSSNQASTTRNPVTTTTGTGGSRRRVGRGGGPVGSEQAPTLGSLMDDDQSVPVVSLGDASVAAPFTSKFGQVSACLDIVRQGRCTLVTTMQMYQILALQCLISAYSLSVLYLDGVKLGDTQMTITGVFVAIMFLFISRASPLERLSPERPQSSVFSLQMALSICGQFLMHLTTLIVAVRWAHPFAPTDKTSRDPDGEFSPNVLNTIVYLISSSTTLATFAANYKGHPFMASLKENKALYNTLCAAGIFLFVCGLELMPPFNAFLQLHPMPSLNLRTNICILMAVDFIAAVGYERALSAIFLARSKLRIT